MKSFKELSINDKIYQINKAGNVLEEIDKYGNKYPTSVLSYYNITNIQKETDEKITFNKGYSYHLLSLSKIDAEKTKVQEGNYIYFTSKEEVDGYLKEFLLEKIKEAEKYIEDTRISKLKFIANVRKNYFEILNNV